MTRLISAFAATLFVAALWNVTSASANCSPSHVTAQSGSTQTVVDSTGTSPVTPIPPTTTKTCG